jgi:putative two-component system response regulator
VNDIALKQASILIVDDQPANIIVLERLLEVSDFTNVASTTDSAQVVSLCAEREPDILLLDLQMPDPDGFQVMTMLEPWTKGSTRLPILVLTADTTREAKTRALSMGASDFLHKPFDLTEVILRIENLLRTRLLQLALRDHNRLLEQRVRERTRDLEEARVEVIDRLALAAEYRDDTTGQHTQRVGRLAALLARELGLSDEMVELIRLASPLHDVGKVGVSDAILLKPGKFTPMENEAMKLHVSIGSEILGRSRSRLLQLSEEIARTHHERWDGSGYLEGLKGEEIPLSGRIVAVADALDTMTHGRPYKERRDTADALAEIRRLSGRQFDPQVVDALCSLGAETVVEESARLHLVA